MKSRLAYSLAIGILIIALGIVFASEHLNESDYKSIGYLQKGKKEIKVEREMYASEFIALNPEIEYVSYFDKEREKTIAYLNVFGGVGQNFEMRINQSYEIFVSKDTQLKVWEDDER